MNNSATLFVDDGGQTGIPVIFLHSLAGSTQHWTHALAHLRQSRRAVAIGLPGHRESGPASSASTVAECADLVIKTLDQLAIGQFILVGHSLGGSIAVAIAGTIPNRVCGLLLVDSAEDATQMPQTMAEEYVNALQSEAGSGVVKGYWGQMLTDANIATNQLVMADLEQTSHDTVVALLTDLLQFDPKPLLCNYSGARLAIIQPQNNQPNSMHQLVADFPYEIMTDTSHWLQLDEPSAFNQLLNRLLDESA